MIGFANDIESKATLQCYPDKDLASDISARKLETECLLKYEQEFYPSLPIYVLLLMNFGLVLVLSVIYAFLVKDRVGIFVNHPSATTNGAEDESQLGISQAASDPMAHQGSCRCFVFAVYLSHVILCRIILLVVFAALLLDSSNFPVQFHCPWPMKTTSMPHGTLRQDQLQTF